MGGTEEVSAVNKNRERLHSVVTKLGFPEDSLGGVPRVTLMGTEKVMVENHRGLLGYSREEIAVACGRIQLRIGGSGLELYCMTADCLVIRGKIAAVELHQGTGGAGC